MLIKYKVTTAMGKSFTYTTLARDVVGTFEDHHEGLRSVGYNKIEILSPIPRHHLQCTIAAAEFRRHSQK